MFKFFAVVFAALLAVAIAAPKPEPGVVAYSAPAVAYSAYSSPSLVSGYAAPAVAYGASPYAYSGYGSAVYY